MYNHCYILSATQVSCQEPLSEGWMESPIIYDRTYVRAIEPDSKEFIVPSEARRMSRILKRTICSSITSMNRADVKEPDAIITGTGMGCMENSEKFLTDLSTYGENCLKPTLFMQSTHNTISSLIAIILKNHGYNNTYSHRGISFESALLDAWIQIKSGMIRTALVGAHDEVTPFSALVFEKTEPYYGFVSEASVSTMLSATVADVKPMCEVASVDLLYKPTIREVAEACGVSNDTIVLTGMNGNAENDTPYLELLAEMGDKNPVLRYKHLFGDNFSASAIGVYVAANMIDKQMVPDHLVVRGEERLLITPGEIVVVSHSEQTNWSVIKLKKVVCGNC